MITKPIEDQNAASLLYAQQLVTTIRYLSDEITKYEAALATVLNLAGRPVPPELERTPQQMAAQLAPVTNTTTEETN